VQVRGTQVLCENAGLLKISPIELADFAGLKDQLIYSATLDRTDPYGQSETASPSIAKSHFSKLRWSTTLRPTEQNAAISVRDTLDYIH
jgi:hypothetical protein